MVIDGHVFPGVDVPVDGGFGGEPGAPAPGVEGDGEDDDGAEGGDGVPH